MLESSPSLSSRNQLAAIKRTQIKTESLFHDFDDKILESVFFYNLGEELLR